MRTALILTLVVCVGCASTTPRASSDSPCNDPLYVELKKKSLEEMTEREYEYFMQKDAACTEAKSDGGLGAAGIIATVAVGLIMIGLINYGLSN